METSRAAIGEPPAMGFASPKVNGSCERCGGDDWSFEILKPDECGEISVFTEELIESPTAIEEKADSVVVDDSRGNESAMSGVDDDDRGAVGSPPRAEPSQTTTIIRPHRALPKPEAPPGLLDDSNSDAKGGASKMERSRSAPEGFAVGMPAIGKFIRDRSSSFSSAITKRLSSMKASEVTEFNLSGLKVVVQLKSKAEGGDDWFSPADEKAIDLRGGRISLFSRSNCRDSTAVRSFFREKGLKFVEINIDVYPAREKELIERTGGSSVPQIFFNEKLLGGLVALNSLRNSGLFEQRAKEMLRTKSAGGGVPQRPAYGFDDPEEERTDEMIGIVRVLRQRLPIQDRLMKMKIVKNCFAGSEMVQVMLHHLHYARKEAIEIGKVLARKHFIHHVFGENGFEDGNKFYRFLEHEPFIPKCFNFRGSTNDYEPKPAAMVAQKLAKIMAAILESYASDDRAHVDYVGVSKSEEFRRYVNLAQELHRVNILTLTAQEKLAFFLNLHNAMVIHAIIRGGRPEGMIDRRSFFSDFQYLVGGDSYSLSAIRNGILRNNQRPPYSLVKPFGAEDRRLELVPLKLNPLIHFGLCNGTRSSPTVRFFSPQSIDVELRCAAKEFFQRDGIEVNLEKRTVHLTRIMKWYDADFGSQRCILKWVMNYLDATKAGLLMHLLGDGGPVNIVYQNYNWSVNS